MSTEYPATEYPTALDGPAAAPQALLVTGNEALYEDVALIAAVASIRLQRCTRWADAPATEYAVVMCSVDALPFPAKAQGPVLLIGSAGELSAAGELSPAGEASGRSAAQSLWSVAAQHSALWPVPLPAAEAWLSEHMGSRASALAEGAAIAVSGSVGGAGASTVGYLLTAALAARSVSVVLVDADAGWGSGVSGLLHGTRQTPAGQGWLGWEEVSALGEEIAAAQLAASLPRVDGIHVLTRKPGARAAHSVPGSLPGSSWAENVVAAVRAARRAFDVVVIDVGRRHDVLSMLSDTVDHLLIVTPGTPRGVLCANETLAMAGDMPASAVINAASAADWEAAEVSRALGGLRVLAELPRQRWLGGAGRISEAYDILRARRGARIVDDLVQGVGRYLVIPAQRGSLPGWETSSGGEVSGLMAASRVSARDSARDSGTQEDAA